jgi:hypothetical protein
MLKALALALLAQISILNPFSGPHALNPFAAPQGSVSPLTTATASTPYPCSPPATNSTGYVPREGSVWLEINDKLGMNNGMTWNHNTPYAVCLGTASDYARVELHDTTFDHGQNDPSTKRRAEFETSSKFVNGVESWQGYSFRVQVTNLRSGFSSRLMQVHWPSAASPAIGDSIKYANGGLIFVVSTKNDNTDNVIRGQAPLSQGTVHDVVTHFLLGVNGYEDTYLDGKLISHFVGFVGSDKLNGYRLRLGNYGTIPGMQVVTEYKNITTPPNAKTPLTARIAAPMSF